MSGLAVQCVVESGFLTQEGYEGPSKLEEVVDKTRSVWGQIYTVTISTCLQIVPIIRQAIGSMVRDNFFFPLKCASIANTKLVKEQLKIEEDYYRDFWDPSKPLDPHLADHAKIREKFFLPEDRKFSIPLKDGRIAQITCRIIQTKMEGQDYYNFVQVPGIFATISNNIGALYPYLSAYLHAQKEEALPPARFIILSENNLDIKPTTLEESGFILLETLKALHREFGPTHQVVAHSLGNVFLASALKQMDDPSCLPQHICFDRGPTSIWEVSKHYCWGLGRLIYLFVKCGKWASDIEGDIVAFCKKWEHKPTLLVTGVVKDHHFSDSANLCFGEKIKKLEDVDVLVFNPPYQLVHDQAQHNLRPDFLNSRYLLGHSDFIGSSENLSEAIMRHSLATFQSDASLKEAAL